MHMDTVPHLLLEAEVVFKREDEREGRGAEGVRCDGDADIS